MKISKLFHWLYASVMMLPLVVAPVYAIFMHRHPVTNYEVETGGFEITEKFTTNDVDDFDDIVVGNIYHFDFFHIDNLNYSYVNQFTFEVYYYDEIYLPLEDFDVNEYGFYDSYNSNVGNYLSCTYYVDNSINNLYISITNANSYVSYFNNYGSGIVEFNNCDIIFYSIDNYSNFISLFNDLYFDDFVTIPTASTFQSYDYQYNDGLTYNDTDIGSQFIYSIYLPLNKYFNVTNFLGLNDLYAWINTNVFNGVAPLGFNIFYMLLSYWLLVSIFWLVFDVVMYVPNLAHRWLDKASLD